MSDPVDRVAQALYMLGAFDPRPKAERAISEYKSWLAEQGVPVDRLLSDEMRAVDTRTAERGEKVNEAVIALNIAVDKAERAEAQADYAAGQDCPVCKGKGYVESVEHVTPCHVCGEIGEEIRRQANIDHAAGQVIAPEDRE